MLKSISPCSETDIVEDEVTAFLVQPRMRGLRATSRGFVDSEILKMVELASRDRRVA